MIREQPDQLVTACQSLRVITVGDEFNVEGLGPRQAASDLAATLVSDGARAVWYEEARMRAIVGSCPRSLGSAKSGMRAYVDFCRRILKKTGSVFPPDVGDLLAWSRVFRHPITFQNYLGYIKSACEILNVDTAAFRHDSLRRAKTAVDKREAFKPREPMFIRQDVVAGMVCYMKGTEDKRDFVMLCLFAYAFLLRVLSEALPVTFHAAKAGDIDSPVLRLSGESVILDLPRRKNKRQPTTLARTCWCSDCFFTCPVHVLGEYLGEFEPGAQPFRKWRGDSVLVELRELLVEMGIEGASQYRSHDLRRGHNEDLRARGGSIGEMLSAGGWNSAAFMCYLDKMRLECDRTAEAHGAESSSKNKCIPFELKPVGQRTRCDKCAEAV